MVFQGLADRLQKTFANLKRKGKLSETDVKEAMREVRLALLEADVNFKVVKQFVDKVKERAIGQEVLTSLTPGQQVIKLVNEELTELMGGTISKLELSSSPPTVIMMVGLQGAGKTTTTAKLAMHLKKQTRKPLLVAADIYRPAAIKQLQVLGEQLDIPVFSMGDKHAPADIAAAAHKQAIQNGHDYLLIDTAGRLHIDEKLMQELVNVRDQVKPHEILLVVDSMTGQDVVNVAESFQDIIGITGIILTKLDGDTRGGAALSVRAVTGCPVKFAGIGEKIDALEPFHPDRMASRILGMGDVLTLIEKAQANIDEEKSKELEKKMRTSEFTFDDFLDQMEQVRNMGPLDQVLGMMPGANKIKGLKDMQVDEKQLVRVEAIIKSMTKQEKQKPDLINASRRKRIATGSGTTVADVNRLLKQFTDMKKMMKQFMGSTNSKGKKKGKSNKKFNLPFF